LPRIHSSLQYFFSQYLIFSCNHKLSFCNWNHCCQCT
jgi:hypothetical protein